MRILRAWFNNQNLHLISVRSHGRLEEIIKQKTIFEQSLNHHLGTNCWENTYHVCVRDTLTLVKLVLHATLYGFSLSELLNMCALKLVHLSVMVFIFPQIFTRGNDFLAFK